VKGDERAVFIVSGEERLRSLLRRALSYRFSVAAVLGGQHELVLKAIVITIRRAVVAGFLDLEQLLGGKVLSPLRRIQLWSMYMSPACPIAKGCVGWSPEPGRPLAIVSVVAGVMPPLSPGHALLDTSVEEAAQLMRDVPFLVAYSIAPVSARLVDFVILSLATHPAAARWTQIDRQREYESHNRPERPVAAEPVVDGRIPEESGGKEYEADDRPEDVIEGPAEPVSEEPENGDDQSRCGESKQSHQAGHDSGFLARAALRSGNVNGSRS
jgi:hypothetical protein